LNYIEAKIGFSPLLHLNQGGLAMIEHAINFIGSFFDVPGWVNMEVKDFANLMGTLFLLVTLAEILMVLYDRIKERKKERKVIFLKATKERFAH
jgi:hypothetical protein